MAGVAKVDATLVGPLVGAILQADHVLAGLELLFGEVSHIGISLLGPHSLDTKLGGLSSQRL